MATGELVDIRIGRRRADGSVRYVVRPIPWVWVAIMAAISLGFAVFIVVSGAPWYASLIWPFLPLGMTPQAGFDLRPREREIYGWQSLAFIPYGTFTLRHLKMPRVHSSIETHTSSEGLESSGRVTRLYWGNRNLRTGLDRGALNELLAEARRLAEATPGKD